MDTKPARDTDDRPRAEADLDHDREWPLTESASEQDYPGKAATSETADFSATIRDMAEEFGISLRAIRFYEDRGLLHPRRRGCARVYGPRERLHLKMILKGKELGFTLSEIKDILAAQEAEEAESRFANADFSAMDLAVFGLDPALAGTLDPERIDVAAIDLGKLDLAMALRPEQLTAQIDHLERQRKDLDEAIVALREAHRRRFGRAAA